jgi:hypothetical protein
MFGLTTFLAPGQRYIKADLPTWRADYQITIVEVQRDGERSPSVTFRVPNGQLVRGAAVEFELAITVGDIVPVMGAGQSIRC